MALPTTSGLVNYTLPGSQIIAAALRLCNVIQDEETPTAAMTQNGLQALNAMVTGWEASQIHVWTEEECILFLQTGQNQYQLGAGSPDHACLYNGYTQTQLTNSALAGATSITVSSIAGLANGNSIGIQLTSGSNFWTTISGTPSGSTVTLASGLPSGASTSGYVFAYSVALTRPLRVPAARRFQYSTLITTPLIILSRLDYDYLPNAYSTGLVNSAFYDPQTGNGAYNSNSPIGLMNCWPSPSDNTYALRFVAQRPIQYFSSLANVPDFPAEWTAAIKWNLAVEIAPEYDVPAERLAVLERQAAKWYQLCAAWDKEPEPVLFGVSMYPGANGR